MSDPYQTPPVTSFDTTVHPPDGRRPEGVSFLFSDDESPPPLRLPVPECRRYIVVRVDQEEPYLVEMTEEWRRISGRKLGANDLDEDAQRALLGEDRSTFEQLFHANIVIDAYVSLSCPRTPERKRSYTDTNHDE